MSSDFGSPHEVSDFPLFQKNENLGRVSRLSQLETPSPFHGKLYLGKR